MMYRLPDTLSEDIQRFGVLSVDYREKKIGSVEFKSFRVPMGVYEQRENEVYMSRIRTTGGVIYPKQFLRIIDIALRHHSDLLHITTRQEIQIQNLKLEEIQPIFYELQEIGLTTKGGGGNTIRNILVSYNSGITNDEVFDTTPYAIELTTRLIAESDSYLLPRKMKIAFSSSDKQVDYAAINDLGFVAKIQDGQKGFGVYVGGGAGSKPAVGWLVFNFIPESELFIVSEAVKKMFSEHGNRKNRNRARIRYIFYNLGEIETIRLIREYYETLKKTIPLFLLKEEHKEKLAIEYSKSDPSNDIVLLDGNYEIWKKRYVIEQRQIGYMSVLLPFALGNLLLKNKKFIENLKKLLNFVSQFGQDTIRFTTTQNVQLRNIPGSALPELYLLIKNILPEVQEPLLVNNIISCTGADTCRLGICLSKGLTVAISDKIKNTRAEWDKLATVRIHISGCPNSCGQQLWADIGFSGKALRNNRLYPGYQVYLASNRSNNPRLAELVGSIAARDIPEYVVRLLISYLEVRLKYKNLTSYLENEGKETAIRLLNDYQKIPSFEDDKSYYFDWGASIPFNIINRKKTECSSGLFDMINVDLNHINDAKKNIETEKDEQKINKYLYDIIYFSSHMLLITRGVEPKTTEDVFNLFLQYFLDKKLVENKYYGLLEQARDNKQSNFVIHKGNIYSLSDAVVELYRNMDDSLHFKNVELVVSEMEKIKEVSYKNRFKDLRGVICPMNFVKVKIQLASMQSGEKLEIWLDDNSHLSVIISIQNEGHQILEQDRIENYWKVIIKKK